MLLLTHEEASFRIARKSADERKKEEEMTHVGKTFIFISIFASFISAYFYIFFT